MIPVRFEIEYSLLSSPLSQIWTKTIHLQDSPSLWDTYYTYSFHLVLLDKIQDSQLDMNFR